MQPESSLTAFYQSVPSGHLLVQTDGLIVHANQTLLMWTGYTAQELCGKKRLKELLTRAGALLYESYCAPLLRLRGSIGEIALDLLCKDGKPFPVLLSATAPKQAADAPALTSIAALHAPTRREYERELLRARGEAEHAAAEVRQLHYIAQCKMEGQERLLKAVGRLAAGDLESPVEIEADSSLTLLAQGLEQMRKDLLRQMQEMREHTEQIQQLNIELRHQIEQRSRHLVEAALSHTDYNTAEALPLFPQGTLLADRYLIRGILGQGGMGTVYEVERTSDKRILAAKVLGVKPDYQSLARFAREAQLLARIQHPNLIDILDTGITDERVAYIIMERVHGKSLAERSTRYRELPFVLPVLLQIADALSAVHAAGIVHRDLKPANVLILEKTDSTWVTAKLVDFGVSRLLDQATDTPTREQRVFLQNGAALLQIEATLPGITPEPVAAPAVMQMNAASTLLAATESPGLPARPATPANPAPGLQPSPATPRRAMRPSDELTQAGTLLGTPMYMAPELVQGAKLARPPADMFSFGVLAYEVLTGELPFQELPLLLAHQGAKELRFRSLREACPGIDAELACTLERCLSMTPEPRPSAAELSILLSKSLRPASRPPVR